MNPELNLLQSAEKLIKNCLSPELFKNLLLSNEKQKLLDFCIPKNYRIVVDRNLFERKYEKPFFEFRSFKIRSIEFKTEDEEEENVFIVGFLNEVGRRDGNDFVKITAKNVPVQRNDQSLLFRFKVLPISPFCIEIIDSFGIRIGLVRFYLDSIKSILDCSQEIQEFPVDLLHDSSQKRVLRLGWEFGK